MTSVYKKTNYFYILEVIIGVALATGHMTSFRFFGLVGISEILFFIAISMLAIRYLKPALRFKGGKSLMRMYIFFTIFIIAPFVTFFVYYESSMNKSAPIYTVSFMMAVLLFLLLVEAIKDGLNLKRSVMIFAFLFIALNGFFLIFFQGDDRFWYSIRYTGGAKNPNQLMFYATSLSLLVVVYLKKSSLFLLPPIIFIGLQCKSDAYLATLFIVFVLYTYAIFFYFRRLNFKTNLLLNMIIFFTILLIVVYFFDNQLQDIWASADEGADGGGRVRLLLHAVNATMHSPLVGFGYGGFSGVTDSFLGSEAHNTFLDFAMQFGVVFPILIYFIYFSFFFRALKEKRFLVAAFTMSFIAAGFFHFNGRHFIFWFELAVFFTYLYSGGRHDKVKKCVA